MYKSKHFAPKEFERCDPPCKIEQMDGGFLSKLDTIRELADIPLVLNCAYRSKAHDLKKGRSGNSAHTKGLAVDIRCTTSANRFKIVAAAVQCGITRIGIGKTFIHLDADPGLPQQVIWHYYE
ncbi:MAG: hypothetical protein IJU13_04205 [Bacteroidales bacterium]|nr:hypothetical protein [Bacteroidales bacterium]